MTDIRDIEDSQLFSWSHNPSWSHEGGTDFDGNWVPDCGGKLDYDPVFLWFSCRVWADGAWIASLYMGEDTKLEETSIRHAGSVLEARRQVEDWCTSVAKMYRAVIAAHLSKR